MNAQRCFKERFCKMFLLVGFEVGSIDGTHGMGMYVIDRS
jgi:hypothetical protein